MKKIRLIRLFIATSLLVLCSCEVIRPQMIFGTLTPTTSLRQRRNIKTMPWRVTCRSPQRGLTTSVQN